jgi:hypothetical protein
VVGRARRIPRGFFTTDALVGLFIVTALAAALAVAAGRQRRAVTRLADSREAVYLAERALVCLQSGRSIPSTAADERIGVTALSGAAPAGQRWVRVTTTVRQSTCDLVGLVPGEAPP